jgi:hypothetical protein
LGENRQTPRVLARSARFDKLIQFRSGRHLKPPGAETPRVSAELSSFRFDLEIIAPDASTHPIRGSSPQIN